MNGYSIPKATLGRLPQYLEYLKGLPEIRRTISATAIAKELSLGDVQVRKDLAAVSGAGKPKIGYETDQLIADIESHLGYERLTNAVLVGAGKLGKALLDYDGFEDFGVKIIAGFDCNETPLKNGTKDILPIKEIGAYCREHNVKLGVITVGGGSAQEVCDKLVESGIEAIWNFAPVTLKVPNEVLLKQENLALSLAYLKGQIAK
jgi:redox-sensing transcriptional repressor